MGSYKGYKDCLNEGTREEQCWRFYAVPTARVIFTAKVLMYSVLVENKFGLFQSWVIETMR